MLREWAKGSNAPDSAISRSDEGSSTPRGPRKMKCPHCTTNFHDDWQEFTFVRSRGDSFYVYFGNSLVKWSYRTAICSECKHVIIEIAPHKDEKLIQDWRMVYPLGASRGPVSPEVPIEIKNDYVEACEVLPLSAKASAALSRRCLQNILRREGYKVGSGDLAKEIDILLNDKAIPVKLRETIDAIRNFGNFSAHPVNDRTALQLIEVEPHEAEWCLEILEECFEHFYVGPAITRVKKAALNEKLASAGKPQSK
jgi:hypothetical protein